jgi:phosphoenolpyruvate carboxylase
LRGKTSHPDNASPPYRKTNSDTFVSSYDEVFERYLDFAELGCEEYRGIHVGLEGVLETLVMKVVIQGQKIRMFDRAGNEILPLREMLEQGRRKREELERRVAELEQKLKSKSL